MALGKRASAGAVVKAIMSNANGIGTSKTESRNNSGVVGQNGHNISTKAHSISSIQNLRTVATQYVNFVNENYEGRVLSNISPESIRDFIDYKAESLADSSINTYISELGKIADNLQELGYNNISREEIVSYREDLGLERTHENRAYDQPEQIIESMYENSPYGLSAELQLEVGLRVDDALNSQKWSINEDNSLTITGSKGGIEYQTAQLEPDLIEKVREAIEHEYKGNYTEYRETLKENSGEKWNGTHGLRYNFAQDRMGELQEQGLTYNEALSQTSLELGHSREEITLHYLKNS
ncbi:hypothetical protein ACOL22_07700 [Aliarcobacter butzleri]